VARSPAWWRKWAARLYASQGKWAGPVDLGQQAGKVWALLPRAAVAHSLSADCGISCSGDPQRSGPACQFINSTTPVGKPVFMAGRAIPNARTNCYSARTTAWFARRCMPHCPVHNGPASQPALAQRLLGTGAFDAVLTTASVYSARRFQAG
jgi:hypothetical protein